MWLLLIHPVSYWFKGQLGEIKGLFCLVSMISSVRTAMSRSNQSSKSTKKDDLTEQSVNFVMFKHCENILIELLDPCVMGTKGDVTEQRLNQGFFLWGSCCCRTEETDSAKLYFGFSKLEGTGLLKILTTLKSWSAWRFSVTLNKIFKISKEGKTTLHPRCSSLFQSTFTWVKFWQDEATHDFTRLFSRVANLWGP